jgi:IS5 family transposase
MSEFVVHRAVHLLTLPATLTAPTGAAGGGPGVHEGREAVRACRRRPHTRREACGGAPVIETRGVRGAGATSSGPSRSTAA